MKRTNLSTEIWVRGKETIVSEGLSGQPGAKMKHDLLLLKNGWRKNETKHFKLSTK